MKEGLFRYRGGGTTTSSTLSRLIGQFLINAVNGREISRAVQKSGYGKLPLLRSLGRKVGLSEAMRKVVVYAQSPRENSALEHGHLSTRLRETFSARVGFEVWLKGRSFSGID